MSKSVINEQATLKGSRIPLLGLDAKGHKDRKIRNEYPTSFAISFKEKRIIQIRPPKVWVGGGRGGYLQGRCFNVSVPVYIDMIYQI